MSRRLANRPFPCTCPSLHRVYRSSSIPASKGVQKLMNGGLYSTARDGKQWNKNAATTAENMDLTNDSSYGQVNG
jgi:hypothetical protein